MHHNSIQPVTILSLELYDEIIQKIKSDNENSNQVISYIKPSHIYNHLWCGLTMNEITEIIYIDPSKDSIDFYYYSLSIDGLEKISSFVKHNILSMFQDKSIHFHGPKSEVSYIEEFLTFG